MTVPPTNGRGFDPDRAIVRLRALPWAIAAGGGLGGAVGFFLWGAAGALLGAVAGAGGLYLMVVAITNGAGHLMMRTLHPSGTTTPYQHDFSQIEAHVVRGDLAAAAQLWDDAIAERPGDPEVRVRAADFFGDRFGQPARALALYREVQQLPAPPERHLYVTQRIVDLLLGPLADKGRAVVELRRLIDRWPQSAAARHGREALVRLKGELHAS
ncbi:MAG: hypothetical protein MUF53_09555 [Gemmatimonadaceae bacterium]|jgi:hypothetical protein|nr:hypothetical protein [Gemmatimonadaceae bacterium]